MLPRGEGANVVARVPARGAARGTLVVVAHHDAARTGLLWSPAITQAGARRHLRRRNVEPFAAPVGAALVAGRLGLRAGRFVLAAALALQVDLFRGRTVLGASDNAMGVAVALDHGRLVWAGAGHLPPLVLPVGGEPRFVDLPGGPPLGAGPGYAERPVTLG
ncbi:MAG TPA: hypothetical protein VD931_14780, partial [Baekduia sp.]|nr:hypothetical protein [Baekduia sp.]